MVVQRGPGLFFRPGASLANFQANGGMAGLVPALPAPAAGLSVMPRRINAFARLQVMQGAMDDRFGDMAGVQRARGFAFPFMARPKAQSVKQAVLSKRFGGVGSALGRLSGMSGLFVGR
jgi:hypothetical protein